MGVVAALGCLVVAGAWLAVGGRWLVMETPSMGTRAPVGSLLWTRPVAVDDVAVGDVVTVRPRGGEGRTWTHEVAAVDAGRLATRGVLSGDDPWRIGQAELVGRVERVWPAAGVVVRAAPLLLLGLALTALLAARVREHWRLPVRLLGVSAALSTVIVVQRPLTDARMLAFDAGREQARSTWVNTGQLPLELTAPSSGASERMGPGEVATVAVARTDDLGRYVVTVRPDLPVWTWWLVGGVWALPAAASTARSRRRATRPA